MSKLAEQFSKIFAGLTRSGGRYVVPDDAKPDSHGKILGRAWTAHTPITQDLWEAHLSGKKITVTDEEKGTPITGALGLGICPIREDSTCVFGAIDVDVYPLDLGALQARAKALQLPVIICRTKSGGAHIYLFLQEPASAELVRERLQEWAVALNHPGVEIFPKQSLLSPKSDGSWINIPYSGGSRTLRYALKPDGKAMTPEEFVEAVEKAAVSVEDLMAFSLPTDAQANDWFRGAPPCLQTLSRVGFGDWQNNGLFNVAVYLRMRDGEGWEARLEEYNQQFMSPPVAGSGVQGIIKSVQKKGYFYKCKDQPISAVCNRSVCLKCEFGVGGGTNDPGVVLGDLVKVETDPVLWILPVNGKEIELTTDALTDQRKFRHACIERISIWPNVIKPDDWQKAIREKLAAAKTIKAPEDGTREGQFFEHLQNFCTGRARARSLDEVLLGKPWTDPEDNRVYFRGTDFFEYLVKHRFSGVSERECWSFLRHRHAEHHFKNIKGKGVNLWSVPAFPEQTTEHDVPRQKRVEM